MINDCATLNFAMATLMMFASKLALAKLGKRKCPEAALLSLVGIGVGVVALICVFPNFQNMVQNLPVIKNIIANNGIIGLIVNCLALAATATLAVMALDKPLSLKAGNKPMDLYKCFLVGLIVTTGIIYAVNSKCLNHRCCKTQVTQQH